jgi:hypothetical protein
VVIRLILIWCVTLVLPWTIFFDTARNSLRVIRNPASVEGTVVELRPENHRSIVISYEVGGRTFRSSTSLPETVGLPRFENIHVGDKARIAYNPQYPGKGIPGDPRKLLIGTIEDFALVAVGLLVFSVLLELYLRRWLLQWQSH